MPAAQHNTPHTTEMTEAALTEALEINHRSKYPFLLSLNSASPQQANNKNIWTGEAQVPKPFTV